MVTALIRSQTLVSTSQASGAIALRPQVAASGNGSYAMAWGTTLRWFDANGWGLVTSQYGALPSNAAYGSASLTISGSLGPNLQNNYGNSIFVCTTASWSVNLDAGNPYDFHGNWQYYAYTSFTRANDGLGYFDYFNQVPVIYGAALTPVSYYGNPADENTRPFSIDASYYSDSSLKLFNAYSAADIRIDVIGVVASGYTDLVQLGGPVASNLAISYFTSTGPKIVFTDVNGTVLHTDALPSTAAATVPLASPANSGNLVYAYSDAGEIYYGLEVGAANSSLAQPLYTTATEVISQAGDNSVMPALATLTNGDCVVVWLDRTTGFIEGQRVTSKGFLLGRPFHVSASTDKGATNPVVRGLANGNFVVAWTDVNGTATSAQQSLFTLKSGPDLPTNFAGDGFSGILWRNANGMLSIWDAVPGAQATFSYGPPLAIGNDWQIAGVGDFNGSGADGILWRNANGDVTTWNAPASAPEAFAGYGGQTYHVGADWQAVGVGDFNADGLSDILWRNADDLVSIWNAVPGSYGAFAPQAPIVLGPDWQVAGVGDFSGSGVDGVLWRNINDGSITTWNALASAPESFTGNGGQTYDVSLDWQVAGVGDFNGDGQTDILWRNSTTGDTEIWLANANSSPVSFTALSAFSVGLDWGLASLGDYNGDGKSDILWRNATTGDVLLWQSNDGPGISFTANDLGGVGSDWGIVART